MRKLNKKAALDTLGGLITSLGYIGILLAVIALIVATVITQVVDIGGVNRSNEATFSGAYNATTEVQEAMTTVPTWLPIIVITVIGGALLTLIQYIRGRK